MPICNILCFSAAEIKLNIFTVVTTDVTLKWTSHMFHLFIKMFFLESIHTQWLISMLMIISFFFFNFFLIVNRAKVIAEGGRYKNLGIIPILTYLNIYKSTYLCTSLQFDVFYGITEEAIRRSNAMEEDDISALRFVIVIPSPVYPLVMLMMIIGRWF